MLFARRFWITAACTLGLLFASSAAHAQQIKLLPNDTEMIMTFNLQQILKSAALKEQKAAGALELAKGKISEELDNKGVGKWLKKADFDVFTDLNSITFAIPGGARTPEEGFILLEGKFNAEKIEAAAIEANKEAGGLKVIKIDGVKAFEISQPNEKMLYVGVLDSNTMIACPAKADFTEAVARLKGTKSPKFKSAAFKSLVETVSNKQSISFVATSDMIVKLAEKAPAGAAGDQVKQVLAILKQMEGFSASVTIEKNIGFQLGINTKDADTANKYAGFGTILMIAAKAKVADAARQDPKLEPLVDIVNTIRVSAKGANLIVGGQISFATLEKLLQMVPIPN